MAESLRWRQVRVPTPPGFPSPDSHLPSSICKSYSQKEQEVFNQRSLKTATWTIRQGLRGALAVLMSFGMSLGGPAETVAAPKKPPKKNTIRFEMVRSAAAENGNCLANVRADVRVVSLGPVEELTVDAEGLPPNTEFDFFVIQVPNGPFGLAWYQGDVESNDEGEAHQRFVGRFNIETFIVAQPPAGQPAPVVHNTPPFPDASANPATEPIHTYHLGLWFNSPQDAQAAGCPATATRFNGDHTAGIQVLSTRNFPVLEGPLRQLKP